MYLWNDRHAMEHYLQSDIYQGQRTNLHLTHVRTQDFGVLAAPTLWTWGQTEVNRAA
jgi:hypothetical protein